MDLVRLLLAVWRHKLLALLLLAVCLGSAVAYLQVAPKVYESSASLAAVPNSAGGQRSEFNGLVDRLLPTLAELAKGAEVRESVSSSAPDTPPLEVRAEAPQGTLLLRIHVRHGDPEDAAAWANAVARDLPQFVPNPEIARLQITERARVPVTPVAPVPTVLLPLAALLGLGLAITAAVLAEAVAEARGRAGHAGRARQGADAAAERQVAAQQTAQPPAQQPGSDQQAVAAAGRSSDPLEQSVTSSRPPASERRPA